MKKALPITVVMAIIHFCIHAQEPRKYKSWKPSLVESYRLEGQAWPGDTANFYGRLPQKARELVRREVWDLAKNAAGLYLRFRTNADEIIVRYQVSGGLQFPHMPATGVSGIDLYGKTIDGKWIWAAGKYSFGDTIEYRFTKLDTTDQQVNNREYTLYLPLYNSVKWMELTVPEERFFAPLKPQVDPPVVVYGTSIAQGACASRPGLAWTNILGRKLGKPVINLGFSGNGQLEPALLELMTEIPARIYVLDCLPNMVPGKFTAVEISKRVATAIDILQGKRPGIPILFADHAGYTDEASSNAKKKNFETVNAAMKAVFDSLIASGKTGIFLLTKEEIGQDIESMVDGVHPNDIGMMRYAVAYEKKITAILNETAGTVITTIPVTQRRDFNIYDWEQRHEEILAFNKVQQPGLVLIGNSITHFWGGLPAGPKNTGMDSWNKFFGNEQVVNMGFGWDRIENVLWRIYHGELDSISPKHIVLMIGTNNLQLNTDREIVEGLQFLVKNIRLKQPAAKLLLMGIFPRRGMEQRISLLNKQLKQRISGSGITVADAGYLLLHNQQKVNEKLLSDGLHPNASGYELLGKFIHNQLMELK